MRAVLLVTVFLLGLQARTSAGDGSPTAGEMAAMCRPVVQAAAVDETFHTGVCLGAFASVMRAFRFDDSAQNQMFGICAPDGTTAQQHVRVFIRYVDEHPDIAGNDYFWAAVVAMRQAWPCKR